MITDPEMDLYIQAHRRPTWVERANAVIPGGVNTYSKSRTQLPFNAPEAIRAASNCRLMDVNGRWFIDWTMGLGAISLGYVDHEDGNIYGIASALEVEYAERFVKLLPWPDAMIRYGLHGSDPTEAAVRAARFITGKDKIISQGYHGTAGEFCPNPSGIPKALRDLTIEWDGRMDSLFNIDWTGVACAIVEPDGVEDLAHLRRACDEAGALLVFDEVLTGFRTKNFFHANGDVKPDLLCAAKAIGNGAPLAVITGPAQHMQEAFSGGIGYSRTYLGETRGLKAGMDTLDVYQREPVIQKLHETGSILRAAWDGTCKQLGIDLPLLGADSRLVVKYPSLAHKTLMAEQMFERGICFTVGFTPCFAHDGEAITKTITALRESLTALAASWENPEAVCRGPIMSLPFKKMTSL